MAVLALRSLDNKDLEEKFNRFAADHVWIKDHYAELLRTYPEKYIAVLNKEVEFNVDDLTTLIGKINEAKKDVNEYAVELITTKPRSCLY